MKLIPTRETSSLTDVVSVDELKRSLRIDHTDQDALLTQYIAAATNRLDGYNGILGIALSQQQWTWKTDKFEKCVRLPFGPLISLDEIKYYDVNNTLQTFSGSKYSGFEAVGGPIIELNYGEQWPSTYTRRDAIAIKWTCGHVALPEAIKQAIIVIASSWYESGGVPEAMDFAGLPPAAQALLYPFNRVPV